MKSFWFLAPGAALVSLIACGPGEESESQAAQARTEPPPGEFSSLGEFGFEQREELVSKVQDELAVMAARVDELRVKVEESATSDQAGLQDALSRIVTLQASVTATLAEVESATADTWGDIRTNLESGMTELRKACEALESRLR